jgi:hypothetical protein
MSLELGRVHGCPHEDAEQRHMVEIHLGKPTEHQHEQYRVFNVQDKQVVQLVQRVLL